MTAAAVAFLAGLVSIAAPCVLPLVPGYLSAVTGEAEEPRAGRFLAAGAPFALGFTLVFVALGVGASALAGAFDQTLQEQIAGVVLVVLGLTFLGLFPWPQRMVATGLLSGARKRGSNALLGAAFAVCAAPCIGPVLGSVLVLAGGESTVAGAFLLTAYSAGLASAFLVLGLAFSRAIGAFRWVRDRFTVLRAGSGIVLVALGLLLFFDRFWWLRVYVNRALRSVGLGV